METNAETPNTMRRKILEFLWKIFPFLITILVVLVIILPLGKKISQKKLALAQKQSNEKTMAKAPVNVITMELEPGLVKEKISLPGIAAPWVSLEVVSEIKGKIINKKTRVGQRVKKGDVLAVIDPSDYQNTYDSARASYESALATHDRLTALVKKKFVTQSQLDDAIARVKTSRAALANARLNLSRCTIVSPIKGIVDRVHIEIGKFLSAGDPVALILQIDTLKVEVGIPESDVDAVRKLTSFDMTIDALGKKTYTGQTHYLHKATDSMAHLYTLEIKLDNADRQVLPDMFVRVKIVKQQDPQGIAVPIYSLVSQNKAVGVYVEKDGIVQFRPVITGFQDGWKTQILKGLVPGEQVVVVGHRMIEHGQSVHVTKTIRDMEELAQ